MKLVIKFLLIMALCLQTANGWTKATEWSLDKAHSGIYFDVNHIYSTVRGQFQDFSVTLHFDPDDLAGSSMSVIIQAESIDTNIRNRDNHLRADDFFNTDDYPQIRFQSSAIKHIEGQDYEVTGTLQVKDVSQTITLPFTFFGVTKSPLQKNTLVAGFESIFSIDRLEYNVGTGKFSKMGVIGDDVQVTVSLEMQRQAN
jgi:polyisoprenoid-binding protein YceI